VLELEAGSRKLSATEMKAMAEHDGKDSIGERARESVTGWWGRSRRFLSEVRNETARVTWPSRKEVYATTVVVILTSVFFGVYLWGVDLLLTAVIGWIYRTLGAA
jgi:preprotein translocase subunit SecE